MQRSARKQQMLGMIYLAKDLSDKALIAIIHCDTMTECQNYMNEFSRLRYQLRQENAELYLQAIRIKLRKNIQSSLLGHSRDCIEVIAEIKDKRQKPEFTILQD